MKGSPMRLVSSIIVGAICLFPSLRERAQQRHYVEPCDTKTIAEPVKPDSNPETNLKTKTTPMGKHWEERRECGPNGCRVYMVLVDDNAKPAKAPVKAAVKAVTNATCGCNCPNCKCGEKWVSQPAMQPVRRGVFGWRRR